jgi:hypothetical protein
MLSTIHDDEYFFNVLAFDSETYKIYRFSD